MTLTLNDYRAWTIDRWKLKNRAEAIRYLYYSNNIFFNRFCNVKVYFLLSKNILAVYYYILLESHFVSKKGWRKLMKMRRIRFEVASNSTCFIWRVTASRSAPKTRTCVRRSVDQPVDLVSSTACIRAMKAKRLSRLAVEGLDTGYVVGHESNIESEAADHNKKYKIHSGSGRPFPRSSH